MSESPSPSSTLDPEALEAAAAWFAGFRHMADDLPVEVTDTDRQYAESLLSALPSNSEVERRDPKAIEQRVARSLWATVGEARDDNTYLAQVALTTMAHNPKDALAYLNEYLPNGQAAAIVPALPSNDPKVERLHTAFQNILENSNDRYARQIARSVLPAALSPKPGAEG